MSQSKLMMAGLTVALAAILLIGVQSPGVIRAQGHDHSQHRQPAQQSPRPYSRPEPRAVAPKTSASAEATLRTIHYQQLPSLQNALKRAVSQIEGGNPQAALAELKQVQSTLDLVQKMVEQQVKPPFANVKCPIMGTPIQTANVPLNLTTNFEGQRVAFCCAGCPAAWARLPNSEKAAKLAAAKGEPTQP